MEEKQPTKLQHSKIFKGFLFIAILVFGALFYNNTFLDYDLIVSTLQNSALVLLMFVLLFLGFNIHLAAGDNKVRKIFDHLIFFSFVYYICAYSISFFDILNSGSLGELATNIQVSAFSIVGNFIVLIIIIPVLIMITMIWAMRNVRPLVKKYEVSWIFYFLLLLSILGIIYTLLTPVYSTY